MAENVEVEVGQQVEVKPFTEIEQRAVDQGWRPQDEWDGEPDAWRSAKEFLDRGELFKKIDDQNRTIKEFKRALNDLAKHHNEVREAEYKRARQDLLAQKKQALEEQDADRVIQIDERLDAVKEAQRAAPVKPVVEDPGVLNPVFVAWKDRNSWYDTSEAMRAYADTIGNELGARGGFSPEDILKEVERRVKKEFPTRFENPRRAQAAAVEGTAPRGGKKVEVYELSALERKVMNNLVGKVPGMTEEKYIAELKKVKESK